MVLSSAIVNTVEVGTRIRLLAVKIVSGIIAGVLIPELVSTASVWMLDDDPTSGASIALLVVVVEEMTKV